MTDSSQTNTQGPGGGQGTSDGVGGLPISQPTGVSSPSGMSGDTSGSSGEGQSGESSSSSGNSSSSSGSNSGSSSGT